MKILPGMKLIEGTYTNSVVTDRLAGGKEYVWQCERADFWVSPLGAKNAIATNTTNRGIYKANVERLERALINHQFPFLCDPIIFDDRDKFLQGQHRLHGIINSGETVRLVVVFGMPSEYFEFLDQAKARTSRDSLKLLGTPNPETTGGMVTFLWQLAEGRVNGFLGQKRASPAVPESVELYRLFTDGDDNVLYPHSVRATKASKFRFPKAAVGVMSLLYDQIDPEQNSIFWDGVLDNMGFVSHYDPRKALREHIDRFVASKVSGSESVIRSEQGALWIHYAWKKFIDGKEIRNGHHKSGFLKTTDNRETMEAVVLEISAMAKHLLSERRVKGADTRLSA